MLKICLIPPNPDMRFITEYTRTGSQHVSIDRALDDRRYESAFVRTRGRSQYTTLDAVTTSPSMMIGDVLKIAERVSADEIILPCLLHSRASIFAVAEKWKYVPPHQRVLAPQGNDLREILETMEWGIQHLESDLVAIALHDYIEEFCSREAVVRAAIQQPWFPKALRFHMVGLRGNIYDQIKNWKFIGDRVRSLATSAPFTLAGKGVRLDSATLFADETHSPNVTAPYELSMDNIKTLSMWREDFI